MKGGKTKLNQYLSIKSIYCIIVCVEGCMHMYLLACTCEVFARGVGAFV